MQKIVFSEKYLNTKYSPIIQTNLFLSIYIYSYFYSQISQIVIQNNRYIYIYIKDSSINDLLPCLTFLNFLNPNSNLARDQINEQ